MIERSTVRDEQCYYALQKVAGWGVMKYVQEAYLEVMESEQLWGWRYSFLWNLESAIFLPFSQYYLRAAFALKYTDPAPTELDWDEQS